MKSILSISVIAICVGLYFVYIKPLSLEVKVLSAKKQEYVDVLNRVKEIKEKRDQVFADYDSISSEERDKLNKIIPEKLNPVFMLNDLSVLGSKYGISIRDFRVSESGGNSGGDELIAGTNPGEIYKTSTVTMRLQGEYRAFLNFMSEMESALSLIDIVSLDIRGGGSTSGGRVSQVLPLDYSLEAKIYSLR